MKRIELLTDVRHNGSYYKGEVRVVPEDVAGLFCNAGWAKDLTGELATPAPDLAEKELDVQNGTHGHAGTAL
jgi:hypothetical protein